jgi:hypothetical protein
MSVSYIVAEQHCNRGTAKLMLKEVRRRFGRLRAEICSSNLPSIKAAPSAGLGVVIIDG